MYTNEQRGNTGAPPISYEDARQHPIDLVRDQAALVGALDLGVHCRFVLFDHDTFFRPRESWAQELYAAALSHDIGPVDEIGVELAATDLPRAEVEAIFARVNAPAASSVATNPIPQGIAQYERTLASLLNRYTLIHGTRPVVFPIDAYAHRDIGAHRLPSLIRELSRTNAAEIAQINREREGLVLRQITERALGAATRLGKTEYRVASLVGWNHPLEAEAAAILFGSNQVSAVINGEKPAEAQDFDDVMRAIRSQA